MPPRLCVGLIIFSQDIVRGPKIRLLTTTEARMNPRIITRKAVKKKWTNSAPSNGEKAKERMINW